MDGEPVKVQKDDPPLLAVKVTNPSTYIKRWWAKVVGNEGIYFSFRIKPLTAIFIGTMISTFFFSAGWWTKGTVPTTVPSPTPEPTEWRDTAYTGTLRYSEETASYYLVTTSSSEAISLKVPENLELEPLIGKRIFLAGKYSKQARVLIVADATDTEVLSKSPVPIPTTEPTATPSPTAEPTTVPTSTPEPTDAPSPTVSP